MTKVISQALNEHKKADFFSCWRSSTLETGDTFTTSLVIYLLSCLSLGNHSLLMSARTNVGLYYME